MKFITEYRCSPLAQGLVSTIRHESHRRARLMEFCGSHTVNIFKYGIRQLLPSHIEMISGPGCPVCVTANTDIDKAIALAGIPTVILATFGDMLKVPGSYSNLQSARAAGSDVRLVYSTLDALQLARDNPSRPVIFLGIGFETTAPTVAASVLQAEKQGLSNYFIFSMHKTCPPVIRALLSSGETNLQGLICPGHVSTITGSQAWEFIARDFGIPCVVAGFEPLDILQSIHMLVSQVEAGKAKVEIAYTRGVKPQGNLQAQKVLEQVFEPCSARWRGFGVVAASGLKLQNKYHHFDAEPNFPVKLPETREPPDCLCGEVLRGVKTPLNCALFRQVCRPENPVGPCMVSMEGCCAAYYHFGGTLGG